LDLLTSAFGKPVSIGALLSHREGHFFDEAHKQYGLVLAGGASVEVLLPYIYTRQADLKINKSSE